MAKEEEGEQGELEGGLGPFIVINCDNSNTDLNKTKATTGS